MEFFSDSGFLPHTFCLAGDPFVIWSLIVTNALIALAYFSIPIMLVHGVGKHSHQLLNWFSTAFAIFIFACGTGHVVDIIVLFRPMYWLQCLINSVTAIASLYTAAVLAFYLPTVAAILRDPESMQKLKQLQVQLKILISELEHKT